MSQSVCLTETKSRYHQIQTENMKFQEFIDMIFDAHMPKVEMKSEIVSYVQALETNYNETIKGEKIKVEKLRKDMRKEKSKTVNETLEKSALENLFVESVEDVRRNVIKRRLKSEIIGKKKIGKFDENSEEAKEFEESLIKLADLAKDRVKYSEFNSVDRANLLDLFVNNETTLIKIYDILFPRNKTRTNALKNQNSLRNSSDTIKF